MFKMKKKNMFHDKYAINKLSSTALQMNVTNCFRQSKEHVKRRQKIYIKHQPNGMYGVSQTPFWCCLIRFHIKFRCPFPP